MTERKGAGMTDVITPPSQGVAVHDSEADYQAVVLVESPPEAVFDALTTITGLAGWWAPVTGAGSEGGELRFVFDGEDPLIIHVDMARRPSAITWTVLECEFLPDWAGTTLSFELTSRENGGCELHFRHHGLTPQLECFAVCTAGWDYHLSSLHDFVESGHGRPFTCSARRAAASPSKAGRP